MNVTRWKVAGVAVGVAGIVGASATAYAWTGSSASASAPFVSSVSAHDVPAAVAAAKAARLRISAENAVDWISAITSRLEDKVSALGSPSTLTPRAAEHLRAKIRFVDFLQNKAGDLAAAGTDGAAPLQSRLSALKSKLASILANATVVKPFLDNVTKPSSGTARDFSTFDPDRHHCDGHHDWAGWNDGAADSRGFDSHDGHHHFDGHDHHYSGFHH
jgi:hypothetical protein